MVFVCWAIQFLCIHNCYKSTMSIAPFRRSTSVGVGNSHRFSWKSPDAQWTLVRQKWCVADGPHSGQTLWIDSICVGILWHSIWKWISIWKMFARIAVVWNRFLTRFSAFAGSAHSLPRVFFVWHFHDRQAFPKIGVIMQHHRQVNDESEREPKGIKSEKT